MLWNMIGTTTVPGWLLFTDQRIWRYEQLSSKYGCSEIPGRINREVNISNGASVGVKVGVAVGVGVRVGVGVMVLVGEGVLLGVIVEVLVGLGVIVDVGDGLRPSGKSHPASHPAINNKHNKGLISLLRSDAEKRVVITDFPISDTKGITPIAHTTFGRGGSPCKVARASFSGIGSQGELATR